MVSAAPERAPRLAHLGFLVSMTGKGLLGLVQILGGLFLLLAPDSSVNAIVRWLAQFGLIDTPAEPFAHRIEIAVIHSPIPNETFYTVYLMVHGVLNLGLVLALMARMAWAYPASIAALVGFILYQVWKYIDHQDPMMIVLTVIDLVVIWLIWREWQSWTERSAAP